MALCKIKLCPVRGHRMAVPCYNRQLLVLVVFCIIHTGIVHAGELCPSGDYNGYLPKSYQKPCVGKFNYCIPGKGPLPWDCPRSLVYNPAWNGCDTRKACKRAIEEGETDCLGKPCGLYPGDACNKYYICSGGQKVIKKCVDPLIFDYVSSECMDPSKGAKCKESLVRRPIVPKDIAPEEPSYITEWCGYHDFPSTDGKRNKNNDGMLLSSPQLTDYGDWQPWMYCPNGTYITGVQVWKRSTEDDFLKYDHAGVISIGFKCEDLMMKNKKSTLIGQCAQGAPDDEWTGPLECQKGVGVGLQLAQLEEQGPSEDDVATDNLKMYCSCGKSRELFKPYHKPLPKYVKVGGQKGQWTTALFCQRKQALCGFRSQMQEWVKEIVVKLEDVDMTGLNQVKAKCCDVPSPGQCVPKQSRLYLEICDNTDAEVVRPCPLNTTIGVIYNTHKFEKAVTFYESIGHSLKETLPAIRHSVESGTEPCPPEDVQPLCEQQWRNVNAKNEGIFKEGKKVSRNVNVKPGANVKLFQTTLTCGIYRIYTNQITLESLDLGASEIVLV